ncbi:lipopolysaccharide biosynthesis protein [Rossellomorea aquimaris]|uniref:lipopolysaccharide biosynthesis protein n=1 Tax=Rossellomorea aquimaris TaxID=189382 RepID=UPI0024957931|nr:oligosaccharide flippase family protein [Rossellomorea aquimaris]
MKQRLLKLSKQSFIRNVFIMASGTATAQLIAVALSPIITRLYGPEAYGIMGVFISIIGIVAPISALTYPIAIVLPKSDSEAKGIIRLSLYLTSLISILVTIFLLILDNKLVELFQIKEVAPFLYLIPLVVLFSGYLQVIQQWLIRTKQFTITAKVSFFHALLFHGSMVGVGIFYPVASVLVVMTTLSNGIKALLLFIFTRISNYNQFSMREKNEIKVPLKKIAKKYNEFPKYRAPEVLINAASQSLPILLLTIFFGPASAGFYSIGRTVLGAPSQLIGLSVGDVFYPKINQAANDGKELTNLIRKATLALGLIGIIPFGLVIMFGPWLFSFVFGENWVLAGEYARWIAIWSFFVFMNIPSIRTLPVLSAQAFHLKFTTIMLLTRVSALSTGYFIFKSDMVAIALFGITGAILNMLLIFKTLHLSKIFDKSQLI